ncbi:MAG: hypothetical protein D9V47_10915 [Clostridia bacterium]|nr:MAG: hypothetical protein D9V47_10915 [Clostridia bacterium]
MVGYSLPAGREILARAGYKVVLEKESAPAGAGELLIVRQRESGEGEVSLLCLSVEVGPTFERGC